MATKSARCALASKHAIEQQVAQVTRRRRFIAEPFAAGPYHCRVLIVVVVVFIGQPMAFIIKGPRLKFVTSKQGPKFLAVFTRKLAAARWTRF